jgi:hypothetical protein
VNGTAVLATANSCYRFVNWNDSSTDNPRTDTATANKSFIANFTANGSYTLNYTAGSNGSILGVASQSVPCNGSGSAVTAVPNSSYYFINWNDGSIANPRTDTNVMANLSVTANFGFLSPSGNYSDANNDNHINATDISYVKAAILGRWSTPNPGTDGNADGLITATDISYVKAYILGRWNGSPKYEALFDFASGAGSDKWAKIKTIPSNPPVGNFDIMEGWTEASPTDYSSIAVNDSSVWTVSGTSGCYSAIQCKFTIASNPVNITSIGITLNGSSNINASALRFWAWNFNTSSWRQLGTDFSITTSLSTYTIWSFWGKVYSSYIDGSDHMFILATLNTTAANLNINYIKLGIAYP